MISVQVMQPRLDGSSMKSLIIVLFCFLLISSGAQLGVIGTVSHVGLSFILALLSGHECLDDVMLFYVLD